MTHAWNDVAAAAGARFEPRGLQIGGWSIDSRTLAPGDLFFAIAGPNHDGHDHVATAFEKGACGAVVSRTVARNEGILAVSNTVEALGRIGSWSRRAWGGTVIGVTGSAGKTTTKDVIAALTSVALPTGKTVGNLNNEIGVPLSLLRLPDGCRAAVIEMGMNHAGEIRSLARIAAPDIGVVTNVGYAHIENFDSIEGIALAKRELIESLPESGAAVLNADDARVAAFAAVHKGRSVTYGIDADAAIRARDCEILPDCSRFTVEGLRFESPLAGRHGILNILAGLAVARVLEIPFERLMEPVAKLESGKMRGQAIASGGATLINDCYNSNPAAVRAMLEVLRGYPALRRVAVLGEMLELGAASEPLHRQAGREAVSHGIDLLVGISGAARFLVEEAESVGLSGGAAVFFPDSVSAGAFVADAVRPGDVVLFKGSRGVRVERALDAVLSRLAAENSSEARG